MVRLGIHLDFAIACLLGWYVLWHVANKKVRSKDRRLPLKIFILKGKNEEVWL